MKFIFVINNIYTFYKKISPFVLDFYMFQKYP